MKKLELNSTHYRFLMSKFEEWMKIENYKSNTVISYTNTLNEFFFFLQCNSVNNIKLVEQKDYVFFKNHLMNRTHELDDLKNLKNITINCILKSVNCFVKHFNELNPHSAIDIYIEFLPVDTEERVVLTEDEILRIYDATFEINSYNRIAFGQRDRAIIAALYGCGLRRTEASMLDIGDIDFHNKRIHVRHGKFGKQRFVPIAPKNLEDLRAYIQHGRDWFRYHQNNASIYNPKLKDVPVQDRDALFLNLFGTRMKCFQHRIDKMVQVAMIEKRVSHHIFRHSVATHLLMKGVELDKIADFLGHSSIDSTQIYTHIINQLNEEENV